MNGIALGLILGLTALFGLIYIFIKEDKKVIH